MMFDLLCFVEMMMMFALLRFVDMMMFAVLRFVEMMMMFA